MLRVMTIDDYDQVYALWKTIKGFGIRSVDDSREGIRRFLKRNPSTSVVAEEDGKIVGSYPRAVTTGGGAVVYHVLRRPGLPDAGDREIHGGVCHGGLKKREINKVSLIAFTKNDIGNAFWKEIGWTKRQDLNYYDFTLNEENITAFIQ